jgi:predicted nucleic acid-binding protein
MIIADTSIWIEFFKAHEPYYIHLRSLLEKREVCALSPIFGELLQGVKSKNEKRIILQYWEYLPTYEDHDLLIKAGDYSFENKFIAKGVGLIDASIIFTAIENNFKIWTLDNKLQKVIKKELIYPAYLIRS